MEVGHPEGFEQIVRGPEYGRTHYRQNAVRRRQKSDSSIPQSAFRIPQLDRTLYGLEEISQGLNEQTVMGKEEVIRPFNNGKSLGFFKPFKPTSQ